MMENKEKRFIRVYGGVSFCNLNLKTDDKPTTSTAAIARRPHGPMRAAVHVHRDTAADRCGRLGRGSQPVTGHGEEEAGGKTTTTHVGAGAAGSPCARSL